MHVIAVLHQYSQHSTGKAWYWPKCVLHSVCLCIISEPILLERHVLLVVHATIYLIMEKASQLTMYFLAGEIISSLASLTGEI